MPYDDNYQYDNGDDKDALIQKYLAAKLGPQPEEDLESLKNKQDYNVQLQRDSATTNLMSGLNSASAMIGGGQYKPDNSSFDASNKDRQGQIAANNQQMAAGQQQASAERKNAINEYLSGRKQEKQQDFQNKKYSSDLSHQQFMEKQSQANATALQDFRGRELDLKQQLAEAKASGVVGKQPHEQQKVLDTLSEGAAKRASVSNLMQAGLERFRAAKASGDEDAAVKEGEGMYKLLNSPENPDAVGTEEAKRIGSFLQRGNVLQPGNFFSRDLDKFDAQVVSKINGLRSSAKVNLDQVAKIRGGEGLDLNQIDNLPKNSKSGTATAAPDTRHETRRQFNKSLNQTKITYSDGTTETVDGQ